jgi:hypothetical protein
MKKKLILSATAAVVFLAALQAFNPSRVNPPVKADFTAAVRPPAGVAADLRAACYDCHSFETRWPWYARLAPVSWLIARDVNEGRRHLNLSDWAAEPAQSAKNLDRINEVVDYREMPPAKYTVLHPEARLSATQRKDILDWTDAAADRLRAATNN